MSTYRERREAKAAKLQEWGEKRKEKAAELWKQDEHLRHDWQFITQPGIARTTAWKRMRAHDDKAHELSTTGGAMLSRSAGIVDQLGGAIYSDDPDAIEQLTARIASLEAKREAYKAANVAFRTEHKAELAALTPYGREQAIPHPGYQLTNLGADIRRNKERLTALEREAVSGESARYLGAVRRAGVCRDCGAPIVEGSAAKYYRKAQEIACYPACVEVKA